MNEITYKPSDVGSKLLNNRGGYSVVRKYHMTQKESEKIRERWIEEIKNSPSYLRDLSGEHFFNPYRKGIYHYQIQVLYLLGANKWHSLTSIIQKLIKHMTSIEVINKNKTRSTAWDLFRGKSCRDNAIRCKDYKGRIQENMVFFQRLSRLHPCGYKLKQVFSAVDIKKITAPTFQNSMFYRLSTYDNFEDANPIRDYSEYKFSVGENKLLNSKFIGKLITGEKNEMS